jgi:hypothetical protein
MSKEQLYAFCELLICSDPWPVETPGNMDLVKACVDEQARSLGFTDWIDAYHQLP